MKINIQQSNSITENVSKIIIDTLYNIFTTNSEDDNNESLLIGRVETNYEYEKYVDYLENLFNRFNININKELLIWFNDKNVENVLVNNLNQSNIGGIPTSYKIDLSNINQWFRNNTDIIEFNELEQFKNIKILQAYAFSGCSNLIEIDLSNIETINNNAFEGSGINSLNLLNIKQLYNNCFQNCKNLTSVDLSNTSLTRITQNTFYKCTSLSELILPDTIERLNSSSLRETALTSINVPSSLYLLEGNVFQDTPLTSFDFTNIQSIGQQCFYYSNLSGELNCPSLTSIGARSFSNTKIESITNLGSISTLTSAIFGGLVQGPFSNCSELKSCILPNTLLTIGGASFANCKKLETITGGGNVMGLTSDSVFQDCNILTSLGDIDLSKLQSIPNYTFLHCHQLVINDLSCPNLTSLGKAAFCECYQLKRVSNLGSITKLEGAQLSGGIWHGVFQSCTSLESVVLPNTLEEIGTNCFYKDTVLSSINIPESVSLVKTNAFTLCKGLTNCVLYFKNVTEIEHRIFSGSNIGQVYFPKLETLAQGYFDNYVRTSGSFNTYYSEGRNTINLLYLKLTDSVVLTPGTFVRLDINVLVLNNAPQEIQQNTFFNCNILTIYVPDEYLNDYKTMDYWSDFSDKYIALSEYQYNVDTKAEYDELRNNGDNNIYLIREYMN